MDKVLKIGIIGCGAIGRDHCRRIIETVPGATVVAVSDYVAAAADDTAAKYGIRSFGNDCDGMIKDPEVEAVVITSIDPTHHDYVMKTLAEEKWCFCEKPLSQNAKDCEDIINRELEIGKRLVQVGFMRHYDRGYAEMKRIIETVPGATVVAVSDYVAAAADDTAAKYGIRSFGNDCDGMIKDPEVEAVVITSIDPTHHDYVMKTLAEEKWCFCEKPLSQNAKDCEEIIAREQEIGKRLVQVGFMRHYDRGYAEMKRIIESGELGAPLLIKACHRNVSQGPGFKTENGVTNVAIHELDICRWLLDDEYEDVQCVKVRQSANSDKGYDNPQVMLMRTKKGCFIDVEVQVADGYGYDIQCEVVCENGTVKLPDPYAVVRRSRPAGWDSVQPAESMPIMTDWKERFIEAYDIEFCKWVESVNAGKLTGPSAWDGYVACVAGDALNASRGTSQFLKVETMEKPEMYK